MCGSRFRKWEWKGNNHDKHYIFTSNRTPASTWVRCGPLQCFIHDCAGTESLSDSVKRATRFSEKAEPNRCIETTPSVSQLQPSQTGSVTSKRCMSVISVYVSGRRLACVTVCSQKAAVRCCCWKTFVSRHSYSWTVSAIWQCLQTTHFSETAEPKRWIETTRFAYQPTALPLNQTSSQVNAVSHFCLRTRKTSYMCYGV